MKPNLYTSKELNRTQSRASGTVLVLVIVLEKFKADYEYEHEYEYEKFFLGSVPGGILLKNSR